MAWQKSKDAFNREVVASTNQECPVSDMLIIKGDKQESLVYSINIRNQQKFESDVTPLLKKAGIEMYSLNDITRFFYLRNNGSEKILAAINIVASLDGPLPENFMSETKGMIPFFSIPDRKKIEPGSRLFRLGQRNTGSSNPVQAGTLEEKSDFANINHIIDNKQKSLARTKRATHTDWLRHTKWFNFVDKVDILCADVSDKSNLIIVARNGHILVFDKNTLEIIRTIKVGFYFIPMSLVFSNDGKSFICWNNSEKEVVLCNSETGEYRILFKKLLTNEVLKFIFTDNDSIMAIININEKACVFYLNLTNETIDKRWSLEKKYNDIKNTSGKVLLCSSGGGKCVDVYDIATKELIKTFKPGFSVYEADLTHNGNFLICSGYHDKVVVFNYDTGDYAREFTVSSKEVRNFSISKDDKYLAVADYSTGTNHKGRLLYFNFETSGLLAIFPLGTFAKHVFMDHDKQVMTTIDNNFVNLFRYKTTRAPSLLGLCANKILDESENLTDKNVDEIIKYFEKYDYESEETKYVKQSFISIKEMLERKKETIEKTKMEEEDEKTEENISTPEKKCGISPLRANRLGANNNPGTGGSLNQPKQSERHKTLMKKMLQR